MKYSIGICPTLLIILAGCGMSKNAPNSLSKKEQEQGWQLLFDGKSTRGWHTYGQKDAGANWAVKDKALFLDFDKNHEGHSGSGDLVTNEEYTDFHLKLDWKISDKGNSGIIFYVHEDKQKYANTYLTGPEMQVLDNGSPITMGHPDSRLYTHRAGDLYDMLDAKELTKPAGEWNHIEIKCVRGQLDFYVNGEHALSTTMWNDHWNKMVANSKFKDMPDFAIYRKGHIALQNHGNAVWFRNIKIKRL